MGSHACTIVIATLALFLSVYTIKKTSVFNPKQSQSLVVLQARVLAHLLGACQWLKHVHMLISSQAMRTATLVSTCLLPQRFMCSKSHADFQSSYMHSNFGQEMPATTCYNSPSCAQSQCFVQEWAANNKVPMLQQQVKPQAAINTTTLYKTEEEVTMAPTNILQVT